MKKRLAVHIDCGDVYCEDCVHGAPINNIHRRLTEWYCELFGGPLQKNSRGCKRNEDCIQAESSILDKE
jgi:hypothetical protein